MNHKEAHHTKPSRINIAMFLCQLGIVNTERVMEGERVGTLPTLSPFSFPATAAAPPYKP